MTYNLIAKLNTYIFAFKWFKIFKYGDTMGARRGGGQEGALAPPPLEIQKYGGPPRIT